MSEINNIVGNCSDDMPRILCVDDDESLLAFLDFAFKKEGYETKLISRTEGILDVVKDWQPDVILLDMAIGEACGLDIARDLHTAGMTYDTPIIFITANLNEDIRYSAFLVGAMDFITKPFTMGELVARVNPLTSIGKIKKLLNKLI
jgi:DNA-binding response OmpR family regulator